MRLTGKQGSIVRILWLLAIAAYLGLWGIGTYERFFGPLPDCAAVLCDNLEFSAGDVQVLQQLNLPEYINPNVWKALEVPYSLGFFLIAGLIYLRRSDHAVGLLLSFCLVYLGTMLFSTADDPLRRSYPGLLAAASVLDIMGVTSLVLVLLTFPDGRILSKRLAWVTGGFIAFVIALPLATGGSSRLQGPDVSPLATAAWLMVFMTMIGIGVRSQVHRYRNVSSSIQRQQTKWVVFGMAGYLIVVLLWGYIGYAYPPSEPSPTRVRLVLLATPTILVLSSLVPLSIAFAILRYRLFDIDRLINRTLVYAILSGMLALTYLFGVVVLQELLDALGLGRAPIAVVASTLVIAAMFAPLRRRVQGFIDRRFYRRRYDIEQTLAQFGARMRDGIEVDSLLSELLEVAEDTLQPEHASIWIKAMGREATS
jgi:hypothetical protein